MNLFQSQNISAQKKLLSEKSVNKEINKTYIGGYAKAKHERHKQGDSRALNCAAELQL